MSAPLEQCASIEYDCPELVARIRFSGSAPRRVAGSMADSSAAYSESTPVLKAEAGWVRRCPGRDDCFFGQDFEEPGIYFFL